MDHTGWRERIVAEARTWKGTPYVPGARIKGVGADCGGIVYQTFNPEFGPFPPFPTLPPDWALHHDTEHYLDFIMPFVQQVEKPLPGDLSLFHLGQAYAHAAILLDNSRYIHAWGRLREGCVIETPERSMRAFARKNGGKFVVKHFTPKV